MHRPKVYIKASRFSAPIKADQKLTISGIKEEYRNTNNPSPQLQSFVIGVSRKNISVPETPLTKS